jgi:hypothetical protein
MLSFHRNELEAESGLRRYFDNLKYVGEEAEYLGSYLDKINTHSHRYIINNGSREELIGNLFFVL